jgi:hypothetical protein
MCGDIVSSPFDHDVNNGHLETLLSQDWNSLLNDGTIAGTDILPLIVSAAAIHKPSTVSSFNTRATGDYNQRTAIFMGMSDVVGP